MVFYIEEKEEESGMGKDDRIKIIYVQDHPARHPVMVKSCNYLNDRGF
jgi:hypothetical protein